MSDEEIYQKLNSQLEQVYSEVRALRVNQHVFWEVQEMIRKNSNLRKPSSFYRWMGNMYAPAMSVAIRRLVDNSRDSVSFCRLLMELKAAPQCVSREAYKKRFSRPDMPLDFLDRDYDRLIGAGLSSPSPKIIETKSNNSKKKPSC